MLGYLRSRLSRRRLIADNVGLRLGMRSVITSSMLESNVGIGDDVLVMNSSIGHYTYLGPRCIAAHSTIGRFCSIASEVIIGAGHHPLNQNVALHPIFYLQRPPAWDWVTEDKSEEFAHTFVGNDVWLGAKVIVRDGVRIGDGAVVGAGAVVTNDLDPYGIYVGAPAKLLRYRFSLEVRERLARVEWWNRDVKWLKENVNLFSNVDLLLEESEARGTS